jgi:uncharacterized protein with ParB-like and HNH nuclease domain
MEAGKRRINDILNGSRLLEIPFFQRAYVWEQSLWERFMESMELISSTRKDYFFGTLILKQSSTNSNSSVGDVRTVIDGQQRLTTFLLFLKVLCAEVNKQEEFDRLIKARGEISLRHNCFDAPCFEQIVKQEQLKDVDENSRLARAYMYFLRHMDVDKYDVSAILDHVVFVCIDLEASEDEQVIFDTINSLGVSLTTAELLKNFVFSKETVDQYETIWKPIFENDEETINYWNRITTLGRLQRINLETFLYAYLHIKINDSTLQISSADKAKFRTADNLFHQYKEYLRLSCISNNDFVVDLAAYAKLYRKYITPISLEEEIPSEWGYERINVIIFGLETTTLIPYVLFVLKNQHDSNELRNIFKVLEAYIMRRLICKSGNDNYSDLFSLNLISNGIITAKPLIEFLSKKDSDSSLAMPMDSVLWQCIRNSELTNTRAKGVLYLLESKLRNDNYSTSLKSFNSYSLEHLLPKKWQIDNAWPLNGVTAEERNQRLKTLGNLAIIPIRLNASISNKAWSIKKEGKGAKHGLSYYANDLETMKMVLSSEIWDEGAISKRAQWLFQQARVIWQFENHMHDDNPQLIENPIDVSNDEVSPQDAHNQGYKVSPKEVAVHPRAKKPATRIRIEMLDGRVFEKADAIDTLEDFVKFVGIARVESLNMPVHNDSPLVGREFLGRKLSRAIGNGYYIFVNTSSDTKRRQILNIAKLLQIGVADVKLIPKSQPITNVQKQ